MSERETKLESILIEISETTPQEEMFDVGKALNLLEKDDGEDAREVVEVLQSRYKDWFLKLARVLAPKPNVAFRAMIEAWSPERIAEELGVEPPQR